MRYVYPYPRLSAEPALQIQATDLDGIALDLAGLDHENNEVDLRSEDGAPWNTATLEFWLSGTTEMTDADWEDLDPLLVLECGRSNTRVARSMVFDTERSGWACKVALSRADWYGTVVAAAVITATVGGITGRDVGRSSRWLLRIDDLPANQSIPVTWSDFGGDADRLFLKPHEKEPYFLSLDAGPHLYLNDGFSGLRGLLDDRARRPAAERALHDITRAQIAAQVWGAMFTAALKEASLSPGEGGSVPGEQDSDPVTEWPAEGWQVDALKVVLAQMYPGDTGSDAMNQALAKVLSEDGASLQHLLLPALLRIATVPRLMEGAIKAIESVPESAS